VTYPNFPNNVPAYLLVTYSRYLPDYLRYVDPNPRLPDFAPRCLTYITQVLHLNQASCAPTHPTHSISPTYALRYPHLAHSTGTYPRSGAGLPLRIIT
jgi:hypothetical protein